ncbi:helix-turn-helix domain-containing protein [Streptomyces sp. NBC_00090]|uniref:helix-turn-helix domain-containing protein n=1 Tax=Streptomyces sp. NBC_00090 TaxID=2903619 RepID=UPI0032491FF5
MPDRQPTGQALIQSVQRAVHLLRALNHRGGNASAKQLARDTDLPLPTAYHLLRTLCHEGLVTKDRQGYALGSVCAAVPITVGSSAAALALSLPSARTADLKPLAHHLQGRAESVLLDRTFSITPPPARPHRRAPGTREGAPGVPGAPSSSDRTKDARQASDGRRQAS